MIQVLAKAVKRLFEVDIVLPERVVGIKDQVLPRHFGTFGARWNGISTITSTSTGMPFL